MLKIVIATATTLGMISSALAADLPRREPAPVAVAPVGKAPIGKGPIGKGPVGKGPVAGGPVYTKG
jgi:hypothetical protein